MADLFLGRACSGCGEAGTLICPDCLGALRPENLIHEHLIHTGTNWLPAAHAMAYRGVLRRVLYTYKDHKVPELARVLAPLLASAIATLHEHANLHPHTLLVPVPSRAAARRARGFDPVQVLLQRVQRAQDLPPGIVAHWLTDQRRSGASKRLDRNARVASSRHAFAPARRLRPGVEVIVVDDIITTGSTVSEAARSLERAGVLVRGVAAIAHTR